MVARLRNSPYWNWAGWMVAALLLLLILLFFVLSSLSLRQPNFLAMSDTGGAGAPVMAMATEAPAAAEAPAGNDQFAQGTTDTRERLIIRNGSITLYVNDPRAARTEIEQMIGSMAGDGAFVVSSNERGGGDERPPDIDMSIRVPATRFDEVMDTLAALAVQATDRFESADDVTEEYVDLKARMESLETARQRLLEIMQNAATTEELLLAEQQLTVRETEIESIKGRIQYLEGAARLSSITVYLRPYILGQPVELGWRPAETVRRSLDRLVDSLESFGDWLIGFAIADLPWLIFFGLIVYGAVRFGRWWWRRRQNRAKPAVESASNTSSNSTS